jgi:hypothetical protein
MSEAAVYVCQVDTPDGVRDYVTLLPPELFCTRGLASEAIVGELLRRPGSEETITPQNFAPNRVFVEFMHGVIARHAPRQPGCRAEAERLGQGWIYIIDQRTPTPHGPVPTEDIIGAFEVKGGAVVPQSYRASPNHLILSSGGFFRLDRGLQTCLLQELASRQPEAGRHPRQQHYHFAYTALPSSLFAIDNLALVLARYPDDCLPFLQALWDNLAEQFPPWEWASAEGMKVTAHRIGGKHPVLLVHMPPPERALETYFLAVVLTPAPRYFTLGRASGLPGDSRDFAGPTTLREVSPRCNARVGSFHGVPSANDLLERLCGEFGLPAQVDAMTDEEVRALASQVPIYPAPPPRMVGQPPARPERTTEEARPGPRKRWWEFWK